MRNRAAGIAMGLLIGASIAIGAESNMSGTSEKSERARAREIGIQVGILPTGEWNAITDVAGVMVGQVTLAEGDSVRTGVTVVLPHGGNLFQEKVPAAVYTANGFGKLAGSTQVDELGNLETPIALTNTLSVAAAIEGLVRHTLEQPGNEAVRSVNALVGETNDSFLNDIRGMHVTSDHVRAAINGAASGPVEEGAVGAGTGTSAFGFKGGIGTASRQLPADLGGYTVGVLVQSNYGGVLTINGVPVGRSLGTFPLSDYTSGPKVDGSCMIIVATDAPLCARNLERLAKRAALGLAQTGSSMQNGSGDYVIAFSTAYRIPGDGGLLDPPVAVVANRNMSPLFMAAVEATEEALYNSMFMATTTTGRDGNRREAIPLDKVVEITGRHGMLNVQERLPGIPAPGQD